MITFFKKARQLLVHGGSFKLRQYESACIAAWKKDLSAAAVALLDEQLKRLNVYQRYSNDRLLCFYDMEDKKCVNWPKGILFPCQIDEVTVARLQLRGVEADSELINADVQLCRGRFFGLEFNKSPRSLRKFAEVRKHTLLIDPMISTEENLKTIFLSDIVGEMHGLLLKWSATNLRAPLPPIQRKRLIDAIDAKLPEDYIKLISATDGMTIGDWRICGLAEIRKLIQPSGNYYVIAEALDLGAICIAQESADSEVYLIRPEENDPQQLDMSLSAFIDREIKSR